MYSNNTSTPSSLSPIQERPVDNRNKDHIMTMYPHINHNRNESLESSQFSSDSDDDNNNNSKKLKRVKMKKAKVRPSIEVIESSAPVFQTGDIPLNNNRNNHGNYTANSSTTTLNYNTDAPPAKTSCFTELLRKRDDDNE